MIPLPPFQSAVQIEHATGLYGNNGFDPILGAPFPPVNYELISHPEANAANNEPRLTWTIPDVIIEATASAAGGVCTISLDNYAWPDWSNLTTYLANARVTYSAVKYIALSDNVGQQPDTHPAIWAEDTTVFLLSAWITDVDNAYYNVGGTPYVVGDSNVGTGLGNFPYDSTLTYNDAQTAPEFEWTVPYGPGEITPDPFNVTIFAIAHLGSLEVYSQNFAVTFTS